MLKCLFLFLIIIFIGHPVFASGTVPSYIASDVPDARMVGEGRMTYLTMDIYDAMLYAPEGKLSHERPFALSLTYLRSLRGVRIADRTVEEMRQQGFHDELTLAAWHNTLQDMFPDVGNGTTLTGVLKEDGTTVFYRDGTEIGHISDTRFGPKFFSIWLSPDTSEPGLRRQLLAMGE